MDTTNRVSKFDRINDQIENLNAIQNYTNSTIVELSEKVEKVSDVAQEALKKGDNAQQLAEDVSFLKTAFAIGGGLLSLTAAFVCLNRRGLIAAHKIIAENTDKISKQACKIAKHEVALAKINKSFGGIVTRSGREIPQLKQN